MNSPERGIVRVATAIVCALTASCGGGGGGGSGGSPPQNRAPSFGATQFTTNEDVELVGQLAASDPDGDALTFSRTSDPVNGTLSAFTTGGSFTYRPNAHAFGSDSFSVRVSDPSGNAVNATVSIQVNPVNDPASAINDILRVEGNAIAGLNVLANDANPDRHALTVSIEEAAAVGTASVNTDGSIRIGGLPSGFRGVTRFKYRATESGGAFSIGTAAIFVDIEPFRIAFVADETNDQTREVFLTDLVSPPIRVTAATDGELRLRNFIASANGATVAYRRHDRSQASTPLDLSFVRTANPTQQVRIQLPTEMRLVTDSSGGEQYVVSPDGLWIGAVVATTPPGISAAILVNVNEPAIVHTSSLPAAIAVTSLRFSADSQHLYFLAGTSGETGRSLYRTALVTPQQSSRLTAPKALETDDVLSYAVSANESRIVVRANRNGSENLYYVNPADPGNETRLNHALNSGESIAASTAYQLRNSIGGSDTGSRIAYTVISTGDALSSYVAEVGSVPNPRALGASGQYVQAFRPDDAAVLFTKYVAADENVLEDRVYEALVDSNQPPTLVGEGFNAYFDSVGDAVFMQQYHYPTPETEYLTVGASVRPTFGIAQRSGTINQATLLTHFTAIDRAIVLIGEGPESGPRPPAVRVAVVNAWAPTKLIYVAESLTPLDFRGSRAVVVGPR